MSVFFGKKTDYRGAHNIETNKIECPWCDSIISPNFGYTVGDGLGYLRGEIYVCPNCNEIILYDSLTGRTYPNSKFGKKVNKLPQDIEALYDECRRCYSVEAYSAVSMLSRKLLMHIAVSLGAEPNKSFKYYVDYLDENNYIPPRSRHILEFIRNQGNELNHQIIVRKKEEAEKLINFLSMILIFLYEYADEEAE